MKSKKTKENVKKKINEALMGRCIWKEQKETNKERVLSDSSIGIDTTSDIEVKVANLLTTLGLNFRYGRDLKLKDNSIVHTDFSILSNDGKELNCLIEVNGCVLEDFRKNFIDRIKRIKQSFPNLPIVVITYNKYVNLIREVSSLSLVSIYGMGDTDIPENKQSLIVESDHFNFDYSHFLPWHTGKCADFHGHSSTISVAVRGYVDSRGMIVDFSEVKKITKEAIDLIDHKVFIPMYTVKEITATNVEIEFESKGREHKLSLPKTEVVLLDKDSTVETISKAVATKILDSMPWNITEVAVKMNEGIGKCAVSEVTIVGRVDLPEAFTVEKRPGDLFNALAFYKSCKMELGNAD